MFINTNFNRRKGFKSQLKRKTLQMEALEDRTLLSASPWYMESTDNAPAMIAPSKASEILAPDSVIIPDLGEVAPQTSETPLSLEALSDYNSDEVSKLQSFLEQTDSSGVKNGYKLNSSYNVSDPTTWTGVTWKTVSQKKRASTISWSSAELVGTLDVSNFTSLTTLYCCYKTQVSSLNASGCSALTTLYCYNNDMTSLNVSGCTALKTLDCEQNQLTSLDLTSCTSLTKLMCYSNQLSSLDLSKNTLLDNMDCSYNQILSLDVTKNTALTKLDFYSGVIKQVLLPSTRSKELELIFYTGTWTVKNSSGTVLQSDVNYNSSFTVSTSLSLPFYAESNSRTITFTNQMPVLTTPTVTVSAKTSSAIDLSVNEISDALYYEVQYSTSSSFSNATTKTLFSNSLTIGGLNANTLYYFRVKAINGQYCQNSSYSSTKSARTLQSGQDSDNFSASLVSGVLTITGTTKSDWVEIEQNSQYVIVHQYDAQGTTQLNSWQFTASAVNSIEFTGSAGDDVFKNWYRGTNTYGSKEVRASGGDGDDILIGGSGNDMLLGGEGNDYLDGANGDNQIITGYGFDTTANTGTGSSVYVWIGNSNTKQWQSGSALGDDDVLLLALPSSSHTGSAPVQNWTEDEIVTLLDTLDLYYEQCGNWRALALPENDNTSEILHGHDYSASYNYGYGVYLLRGIYASIHEFGHFWEIDENPYWESFYSVSWDYDPDNYSYTYKAGCVTDEDSPDFEFTDSYGATNAYEDWAQCVQEVIYDWDINYGQEYGTKLRQKLQIVRQFINWLSTTSNAFNTPSNLRSTSTTTSSISLSWGSVSNASNYTLLYSTSSDFTNCASKTVTSNSTTVTGLDANTTYYFKVLTQGNDVHNNSSYSSTVSAKTSGATQQLSVPTLSVTAASSSSVSVTVGSVVNASGYTVQYSTNSNFTSGVQTKTVSAGTTTISGLSSNTTYYFRVKANGSGNYVDSNYSATVTPNPISTLVTPTLSVAATSYDTVSVTVGSVSNASGYTVQYSTNSNFTSGVQTKTVSAGTTSINGLNANTTYYFRVKANGSGSYSDSSYSSTKSATTLPTPSSVEINARVVFRDSLTSVDSSSTLPTGITSVRVGQTVYAEIWLKDVVDTDPAIVGGYLNMLYDNSMLSYSDIAYGDVFSSQTGFQTFQTGKISTIGGVTGVGVLDKGDDEWVRLATVCFIADADGTTTISLQTPDDSHDNMTRTDGNILSESQISYGSSVLEISPACPMDIDGDGYIGVSDYSLLSKAWRTSPGKANWNPACDIDNDNYVGVSDYTFISKNWRKYVTDPSIVYPGANNSAAAVVSTDDLNSPVALEANELVNVCLTAVSTMTASDVAADVPESLTQVDPGDTFFVEIWIRNFNGYENGALCGVTGGYLNMDYTSDLLTVGEVTYGSVFGIFTDFQDASTPGSINLIGGTAATGILDKGDDEWVRLATVAFTAADNGSAAFVALPPDDYHDNLTLTSGQTLKNNEINFGYLELTIGEVAVPLTAPTLSATSGDSNLISVTVGSVANASGYLLEYSTSSDFSSAVIQNVSAGTTNVSVQSPNTTYYFRAKAIGSNGYADSSYSTVQSVTIGNVFVAQNDFAQTMPNTPITITYRANDCVSDWSTTTVQFTNALYGSFVVNGNGTVTYTPEDGFSGVETIDYVLTSSSGEHAQGTITINVGLPVASSVQNTLSNHMSSSAMAQSVDSLTDWDNCYVELWLQGVNEIGVSERTVTLEYNPDVYKSPTLAETADGVSLSVSQSALLPNGNVQVELTAQILKPISSQTDNLFLGTVLLAPSEEGSGVEDVLVPEPVCVLDGIELTTMVEAMPYDLVRNGTVDANDFVAFATVFGYKPSNISPSSSLYGQAVMADFNKDGNINVDDFILFATNFGASKPATSSAAAQAIETPVLGNLESGVENSAVQQTQNEIAVFEPVYEEQTQELEPAAPRVPLLVESKSESSMTLREAYSAALLDLFDNQESSDLQAASAVLAETRLESPAAVSAESDSQQATNDAIDAVLEEDVLAIDWE